MKRNAFILLILILSSTVIQANAVNFGYYKSDYEYGIFDSIKINWKNRGEGTKFIELRTETQEGQKYLDQETKRHDSNQLDENEQYRLMRENTVIY